VFKIISNLDIAVEEGGLTAGLLIHRVPGEVREEHPTPPPLELQPGTPGPPCNNWMITTHEVA